MARLPIAFAEAMRRNGQINPALVEAMAMPSDLPRDTSPKVSPRAPHQRLRGRKQVAPSKLLVRAQELVREAYDNLQSAGSLLLTASAVASNATDRETMDIARRVLCDCSADASQVAYVLPREYSRALDTCYPALSNDPRVKRMQSESGLPTVANGRNGVANQR